MRILQHISKHITVVFILSLPINGYCEMFGPSNYWECFLDKMPGAKNDPAAVEIIKQCRKEFPEAQYTIVEKKKPRFGVKTAGECVLEYGKDVSSSIGAKAIQAACYRLYKTE